MDMEGVRYSTATLLFLTLVLATNGGDDAAAVEQCDPHADEPWSYKLVAFQNKDGEEIRLLADQKSQQVSGFANRSGHWFYAVRDGKRRLLPTSSSRPRGRRAEGLWNTLGVLASSTTAASDPPAADAERYMLLGMRTGGGDKNRLVVDLRYMSITGFAQGFSSRPSWFFRPRKRGALPIGDGPRGSLQEVASKLVAGLLQ